MTYGNFWRKRHSVSGLFAHLVFVTKYRRARLTAGILDDMAEIFRQACLDMEAELLEFNGERDHVHLLVQYPPSVAISTLVNQLKGRSSRIIRMQYGGKPASFWSHSYFVASCGGAPITILRQYIENQDRPD